MANDTYVEFYEILEDFKTFYNDAHPYLSIGICLCGILFNICNVIVLTRPNMDCNPINALLTVIALCDAMVMISYIPFAIWYSRDLSYCAIHWQTYGWALFVLFNSAITVVCHAVSIWLTVSMAFIRAVIVRQMPLASVWTVRNVYILSLAIFCTVLTFSVPGLLSYTWDSRSFDYTRCSVKYTHLNLDWENGSIDHAGNITSRFPSDLRIYMTVVSELGRSHNGLLLKLAFWIHGVLFKMVPCCLLTIFIGVLLRILTEVKKRKIRLRTGSMATGDASAHEILNPRNRVQSISSPSTEHGCQRADRTTLMLIVLLAVFLFAELPQGLLSIVTSLSGTEFRTRVYMNLGTLMDLLSLLNSAANFVIYCAMSQRFREIFVRTFLPTCRLCRIRHHVYETGDPSLYATGGALALQRRATSQRLHGNVEMERSGKPVVPKIRVNGSDKFSSPGTTGNGNRKPIVSESMTPLLKSPTIESACTAAE